MEPDQDKPLQTGKLSKEEEIARINNAIKNNPICYSDILLSKPMFTLVEACKCSPEDVSSIEDPEDLSTPAWMENISKVASMRRERKGMFADRTLLFFFCSNIFLVKETFIESKFEDQLKLAQPSNKSKQYTISARIFKSFR